MTATTISEKARKAHNAKRQLTFNDAYNAANDLGTREERRLCLKVASAVGMHRITRKDIEWAITIKAI